MRTARHWTRSRAVAALERGAIAPGRKLAFADVLDRAGDRPLADEHILLGTISVPDSVAAHVLGARLDKEAEAIVVLATTQCQRGF